MCELMAGRRPEVALERGNVWWELFRRDWKSGGGDAVVVLSNEFGVEVDVKNLGERNQLRANRRAE